MKTKDKKELKVKTIDELKNLLKQVREELFNLKIENSRKKLKNTSLIYQKRKDKARILTTLREKELSDESN